ncbi:ferritin-like domain-containing protein [Natronosalvus caseinilyticus]|uniref:YciE/YciF ferroxidase family protein n=1 Tax=Natronosalvus caseinilyticus TaxID=2953747 RepID=UPI0028B16744|nr:DUF892 family protein [Natronosalvus caseinilyticus]
MSHGGVDSHMIENEADLFVRELAELYGIEHRLEAFQSARAGDATSEDLEDFYMGHSEATTEQIDRLERVFEAIGADPERRESSRFEGVVEEREGLIGDTADPTLSDLVDVETGLAIERLEITKLETLLALADRVDLEPEAVEILRTNKQEAENAVDRLQGMASA